MGGWYIHVPHESGPNNKAMQVSKTESFFRGLGTCFPGKSLKFKILKLLETH